MEKIDMIYELVNSSSDKIDRLNDKLVELEKNTIHNTRSLDEHIRRSDVSEKRLLHIESRFTFSWIFKVITGTVVTTSTFFGAMSYFLGFFK